MEQAHHTFDTGGKRVLLQESQYLQMANLQKAAIDALRLVRVSLGWQHLSKEAQCQVDGVLDQVEN